MLHLLNGDATAAVFSRAGLPGDVAVWRDILMEGPVATGPITPAAMPGRVAYLAERLAIAPEQYRQVSDEEEAVLAREARQPGGERGENEEPGLLATRGHQGEGRRAEEGEVDDRAGAHGRGQEIGLEQGEDGGAEGGQRGARHGAAHEIGDAGERQAGGDPRQLREE